MNDMAYYLLDFDYSNKATAHAWVLDTEDKSLECTPWKNFAYCVDNKIKINGVTYRGNRVGLGRVAPNLPRKEVAKDVCAEFRVSAVNYYVTQDGIIGTELIGRLEFKPSASGDIEQDRRVWNTILANGGFKFKGDNIAAEKSLRSVLWATGSASITAKRAVPYMGFDFVRPRQCLVSVGSDGVRVRVTAPNYKYEAQISTGNIGFNLHRTDTITFDTPVDVQGRVRLGDVWGELYRLGYRSLL